jgi:hypothetical protein
VVRYYVQGLNGRKEPIANAGDAKHPYTVSIRDEISGDAPSLPGSRPPRQCGGKEADCPPDFPGCKGGGSSKGSGKASSSDDAESGKGDRAEKDEGEGNSEDSAKDEGEGEKRSRWKSKRIWVGVSGSFEFVHLPAGRDLCYLDPTTARPGNSLNYYCTYPNGADFPSRADGGAENSLIQRPLDGNVGDQFSLGPVRFLATLDYALMPNVLLGARLGLSLRDYPGGSPTLTSVASSGAAIKDGRASPLGRGGGAGGGGDVEGARGIYLFGKDPLTKKWAPMIFAGLGLAAFDGHASDNVVVNVPRGGMPTTLINVNIWKTGGPFFLMAGGGVRYSISSTLAATGALRFNLALGAGGAMTTFGPELGIQMGF